VKNFPALHVFSLSVLNDRNTLDEIQKLGVRCLRKGETPLKTVIDMIRSRLTGVAYSTDKRDLSF
jgi:hypothetical protein